MTQTFYVGGPMRGFPLYNFAAFFQAAQALRGAGYLVENPAEHDMSKGFNPAEALDSTENVKMFDINAVLKGDFEIILEKCQGLVMLEGWRKSTGACAEVVVAHYSGIQVWELIWRADMPGDFDLVLMTDVPSISFGPGKTYTGEVEEKDEELQPLKVGDRVEVIADEDNKITIGTKGEILKATPYIGFYTVKFDKRTNRYAIYVFDRTELKLLPAVVKVVKVDGDYMGI